MNIEYAFSERGSFTWGGTAASLTVEYGDEHDQPGRLNRRVAYSLQLFRFFSFNPFRVGIKYYLK